MEKLSNYSFKERIFDFTAPEPWRSKNNTPCIIHFYADWCRPCRMLDPVLEELGEELNDRIKIYRINTEKEMQLTAAFGIKSIPALLFVPVDEEPQMVMGAVPKGTLRNVIDEVLLNQEVMTKTV